MLRRARRRPRQTPPPRAMACRSARRVRQQWNRRRVTVGWSRDRDAKLTFFAPLEVVPRRRADNDTRDGTARRKQMLFAALGASIHGMTRSQRQCCLRSPQRRSAAVMSAALHLATIDDAEDFLLSSMCSHSLESVLTLDDAPKLAHSIAIDLDDALAGAMLPISEEGSAGITLCGRHGR